MESVVFIRGVPLGYSSLILSLQTCPEDSIFLSESHF